MSIIDVYDLPQSIRDAIDADTLALIVAGLNAKAKRVAPCLAEADDQDVINEARLILLGTIKRWAEAGSGAFQQQTAGSFSVTTDTRQSAAGYALWPSELAALADLCADPAGAEDDAFMVDMISEPVAYVPNVWHPWV